MADDLIERLHVLADGKILPDWNVFSIMAEAADALASKDKALEELRSEYLNASRDAMEFATKLAAVEKVVRLCERQLLALYNSISPHAEYITSEGKSGNRFADQDVAVIAARAQADGETP